MAGLLERDIEFEREDDRRWIAEIPSLPGVMVYGETVDEARSKVKALALQVSERSNTREGHLVVK